MRDDTVPSLEHRRALTAFFWWTSWAAVTERPGSEITYTSNWPSSRWWAMSPPPSSFMWTVFSVLFLIAGIGAAGAGTTPRAAREDPVPPPDRSAARPVPDAVDEGHRRSTSGWSARCSWCRSCWARSPRTTRSKARSSTGSSSPSAALFVDAQLAHPARRAVDRHRLAGHRAVHRAGDLGSWSRSSSVRASISCSSAC
jgi:hypothetical protein